MPDVLTRRLERYAPLSEEDRAELARLAAQPTHTVQPRRDLIRHGDPPRCVYVILDGWAWHYRTLADGRRQILDFAIPGDLCDLNLFILDRMDHSIGAVTRLKAAEIGRDVLHGVVTSRSSITAALWWQELVSKSISREWIVNVARRNALERVAHLFCEMYLRLESVGLTDGLSCEFPPTQVDIADATGLTPVHVNRTIQELRRQGLVILEKRKLTILDLRALQEVAIFNPGYLHHYRSKRHAAKGRMKDLAQVMPGLGAGNLESLGSDR